MAGLKQQEFIVSRSGDQEAEIKVSEGPTPSEGTRGESFLDSLGFRWHQGLLGLGQLPPLVTSSHGLFFSLKPPSAFLLQGLLSLDLGLP